MDVEKQSKCTCKTEAIMYSMRERERQRQRESVARKGRFGFSPEAQHGGRVWPKSSGVKVRCSQIALRHSQAEQQQVKFGSHLAFGLEIFDWIFGSLFKCECVVVALGLNDKMFFHCLLIVISGNSECSLIWSTI